MPTDFSAAARHARLQIPVPPVEVDAIRDSSAKAGARARLHRIVLAAAASLGVIGGAVAFASIGGGVHVWLSGNNVEATVQSFEQIREPMAGDVTAIAAKATFPVVFPVGLPKDMRVWWIAYDPADAPDMLTIQYRKSSGRPIASVTLIDEAKIRADRALMPGGPSQGVTTRFGAHWRIGRELVIVQGRHLSAADVNGIQAAMRRVTPAESQVAFSNTLRSIVVLQKVPPRVADAAERIVAGGKNVVVADWDIRILPRLAAQGKPLRDSRLVYLTSIPQVHGRPVYRNATLYWPKTIAIPADGVRSVAATLRNAKIGPECACAILVHQSGGAYTMWKIGMTPPYRAEKLTAP